MKKTFFIFLCLLSACFTTAIAQSAITGPDQVCASGQNPVTLGLLGATSGGYWVSSDLEVATVSNTDPASWDERILTGVGAGTATISYVNGSFYITKDITVNALPSAITGFPGVAVVCKGSSVTLASTPSGGTWTSTSADATIDASSGVLSGINENHTGISITYTLPTGCWVSAWGATVQRTPPAIGGNVPVCTGGTLTLTSTYDGDLFRIWSSSDEGIAVFDLLSSHKNSGSLVGVSAGTAIVTYKTGAADNSWSCATYATVTINGTPEVITGPGTVCVGSTITLNSATTGGTWSSSNEYVATVGETSGIVTGISAGTATISYSNGCGTTTKDITVNVLPAAITGTLSVCVGGTTDLNNATAGGTWISGTTEVATVNSSTGLVTGVAPGTSIITYVLSGSGCSITAEVTVSTLSISGTLSLCQGASTTLTGTPTSGSWYSSVGTIAGINTSTGVVTASNVNTGTTVISYVKLGCITTVNLTVKTKATAIPAAPNTCIGSTTTFTNPTSGGTWTSGDASIATVGISSGVVTGVAAGSAVISYTVANGCVATRTVSVASLTVTGGPVCVDATVNLVKTPFGSIGGAWTSSNTAIGTVHSSSGIVGGISAGSVNITFTTTVGSSFSCVYVHPVTINALPEEITGPTSVCVASTITLSNATSGGTWSIPTTHATINSSGVVTGVAGPATATVSYTLSTGCRKTKVITVNSGCGKGTFNNSGFDKEDAGQHYILTPNPTAGDITITQKHAENATVHITLMNYAGAVVYHDDLHFADGSIHLNIPKAVPGRYLAVLVDGHGETTTFKFVVR